MGDASWNSQLPMHLSNGMLKRPRTNYDYQSSGLASGQELYNPLTLDSDFSGLRAAGGTNVVASTYDRYLHNVQPPSLNPGAVSNYSGLGLGRAVGGVVPAGLPATLPKFAPNSGVMGYDGQRSLMSGHEAPHLPPHLPPDASSTLYVEGFPSDCKKREVAHIFRPFMGYKEVRLVTKESRNASGDPLILCFVDFIDPACASTALSVLQGYKVDEENSDSTYLRLQFSRFPGLRSGGGSGRRKRK